MKHHAQWRPRGPDVARLAGDRRILCVNLAIGLLLHAPRLGNIGEFFLSGRSVSWGLRGHHLMVATSLRRRHPTRRHRPHLRAGHRRQLALVVVPAFGMLTVFFFAPLWRRARVLTDMEFAENSATPARPATFLRGFPRRYLALPVNTIIMGWVNLAMAKILAPHPRPRTPPKAARRSLLLPRPHLAYNAISGLWAVLWTDLLQFILKMSMVILLAYFAVHAVGGMGALATRSAPSTPRTSSPASPRHLASSLHGIAFFLSFLVLLSLNWWASWYGEQARLHGNDQSRLAARRLQLLRHKPRIEKALLGATLLAQPSPTARCTGPDLTASSPSSCCPDPPPRRAAWRAPTSG